MRVPARSLWSFLTLALALYTGGCLGVASPSNSRTPANPSGLIVPSQPGNLQAVAGNATVALVWTAPSFASSYTIGRATSSGGVFSTVATPTSPAFNDTGLKNGIKYYYVVAAVNAAGASPNSSPASATPVTPAASSNNPSANPPSTPPANPPAQPSSPSLSSVGEQAVSADAFADSLGINVHLNDLVTSYGNFALVESALKHLGVRHIRDGMVDTTWTGYYDRMNELGREGIKAIFTTSVTQSSAVIAGYPNRVPDSFEGYEAPNEYDLNGGPNWASTLDAFMGKLHAAVKSSSVSAAFPIYGPSLTQGKSFPQTAATASDFDFANLHNYFGGRNPGTPGWGANNYGSYSWNLANAHQAWGNKPIVSTESGYFNDASKSESVPEDVSGKYIPRLLFEQWLHGIQRTYIYELIDLGPKTQFKDATYGMMHTDFSPKAAYKAVQNVMQLLGDPGPSFTAGTLPFTLSGDLTDVHHLLLEKRDGTFYLAIWIEEPSYDVNAKVSLPVPTHSVTLHTAEIVRVDAHQLDDDGQMQVSTLAAGQTQTLEISDRILILQIVP